VPRDPSQTIQSSGRAKVKPNSSVAMLGKSRASHAESPPMGLAFRLSDETTRADRIEFCCRPLVHFGEQMAVAVVGERNTLMTCPTRDLGRINATGCEKCNHGDQLSARARASHRSRTGPSCRGLRTGRGGGPCRGRFKTASVAGSSGARRSDRSAEGIPGRCPRERATLLYA